MSGTGLTCQYGTASRVRRGDGGTQLLLATSGGVTEAGPTTHRCFLSGMLAKPAVARMLAMAAATRPQPTDALASIPGPVIPLRPARLPGSACGRDLGGYQHRSSGRG